MASACTIASAWLPCMSFAAACYPGSEITWDAATMFMLTSLWCKWLHEMSHTHTQAHAHPKDRPSSRAVSSTFKKLFMHLKKKRKKKPFWRTNFFYLSSERAVAPSNTQGSTKPGMFILVFQAHTHIWTYIHTHLCRPKTLSPGTWPSLFRYIPVGMRTLKKQRQKNHVFHTAVYSACRSSFSSHRQGWNPEKPKAVEEGCKWDHTFQTHSNHKGRARM